VAKFDQKAKTMQVKFTQMSRHEVPEAVRSVEFGQVARQDCHQVALGDVENCLQVHERRIPDKAIGGDEVAAEVDGWCDESLGDDRNLSALEGPLGSFDASLIDSGVIATKKCQAAQFPVFERANGD